MINHVFISLSAVQIYDLSYIHLQCYFAMLLYFSSSKDAGKVLIIIKILFLIKTVVIIKNKNRNVLGFISMHAGN